MSLAFFLNVQEPSWLEPRRPQVSLMLEFCIKNSVFKSKIQGCLDFLILLVSLYVCRGISSELFKQLV